MLAIVFSLILLVMAVVMTGALRDVVWPMPGESAIVRMNGDRNGTIALLVGFAFTMGVYRLALAVQYRTERKGPDDEAATG